MKRLLTLLVLFSFATQALLSGCADDSNSTLSGSSISFCKGKPDTDKDGVCDALENQTGTDPNNPNTDAPLDPFTDGQDFDPKGDGSGTSGNVANGGLLIITLIALPLIGGAIDKFFKSDNSSDNSGSQGGSSGGSGGTSSGTTTTPTPIVDEQLYTELSSTDYFKSISTNQQNSFIGFYPDTMLGNEFNWIMTIYVDAKYKNIGYQVAGIVSLKLPSDTVWQSTVKNNQPPISFGGPAGVMDFNGQYVDGNRFTGNDQAKLAFDAVKQRMGAEVIKYSGFFLHRDDKPEEYTTFDPLGIGYKVVAQGTKMISTQENGVQGKMQFFYGDAGQTASSFNIGFPSQPIAANHQCAASLGSSGNFLNACYMLTYSVDAPTQARTWYRTSFDDLLIAGSAPWRGYWHKFN